MPVPAAVRQSDPVAEPENTDTLSWESAVTLSELGELTARWLEGAVPETPSYAGGPEQETTPLVPILAAANRAGYVTTASQPGSAPGPGYDGAVWAQRAAVSGITDLATAQRLVWAATLAGLWVLAASARTDTEALAPVTTRADREYTVFGLLAWPDLAWEYDAEDDGPLQDAIGEAYQVTVIDPEFSATDRLWRTLHTALGLDVTELSPTRAAN